MDALLVLNRAVGRAGLCGPCTCDVDGDGEVLAADALRVLQRAVGLPVELACAQCACKAVLALSTGQSPRSVVAADLDGNGLLDLLIANTDSATLSLFMGDPTGVATTPKTIEVAGTPQSVSVADLDGDGALDLICAHALSDAISVLMGKGDGTFEIPVTVPAGSSPINTAVGDLDDDGVLDIVVANSTGDDLSIRLGRGDGTFGPEHRQPVGSGPRWVALGHIDHDGRLDAVTANRDGDDLSILLGNGDGTFDALAAVSVPAGPYHVTLAAMNADASTDLVVADYSASVVSVLEGNGDGTFGAARSYASGGRAIATAVADLDLDGDPDVAVANYGGGLSVLFADETGALAAPDRLRRGGANNSHPGVLRAVAVADWNGDGLPDLIAADAKGDAIELFRNEGGDNFHTGLFSQATIGTRGFVIADFDRDGRPDLATADYRNGATVVLGRGDGLFTPRSFLGTSGSPYSIRSADLNLDGIFDLVLPAGERFIDLTARSAPRWSSADNSISVLLGSGGGGFEAERLTLGAPVTEDIAVGDVNGDGLPDLLESDSGTYEVFLRAGLGDGSFDVAAPLAGAIAGSEIELIDLNDDQLPDLLLRDPSVGVAVRLALGGGGFDAARALPGGAAIASPAAVADIDGDGAQDLLYTTLLPFGDPTEQAMARTREEYGRAAGGPRASAWGPRAVLVYFGDGSGGFSAPLVSPMGPTRVGSDRPALGDLDGDLALDLSVAADSGVLLLRGDGAGAFGDPYLAPMQTLASSSYVTPMATAIADFDRDGRKDVVAVLNRDYGDNYFRVVPGAGACLSP